MNRSTLIFTLVVSILLHNVNIAGQTIQQLKPNAVPAYVILGVSPTNIERPTTPKELAGALNNAVVDGKLAPNFALDFNPWQMLPKNKNISYAKKILNTLFEAPTIKNNIRNNFNISFATSATDTIGIGHLEKGSSVGIGIKTVLINGKPKEETVKALLGLNAPFNSETVVTDLLDVIETLSAADFTEIKLSELVSDVNIAHDLYEENLHLDVNMTNSRKENKHKELAKLESHLNDIIDWSNDNPQNRVNKAVTYLREEQAKLVNIEAKLVETANRKIAFAREGFILDVNFAYLAHFPNGDYDAWHYAKFAAWTTMSFRCNLDKTFENVNLLDIMFLLRGTANDAKVDESNYTDLGLKLQETYNKCAASVEFIVRLLNQKPASVNSYYTYRLTGSFEYAINNNVAFKVAIGRNFDGNSVYYDKPKDKLFAVAGLNISLLTGQ